MANYDDKIKLIFHLVILLLHLKKIKNDIFSSLK